MQAVKEGSSTTKNRVGTRLAKIEERSPKLDLKKKISIIETPKVEGERVIRRVQLNTQRSVDNLQSLLGNLKHKEASLMTGQTKMIKPFDS